MSFESMQRASEAPAEHNVIDFCLVLHGVSWSSGPPDLTISIFTNQKGFAYWTVYCYPKQHGSILI